MPRGKRLSKKIHDKKKSNPKRNIRKSKKGGIFTKTSRDDVDKLINYMEEFTKKKDLNEICDDSTLSALISRINSVVGSTFGMRRGVKPCSDLFYTNTNTVLYFECEEKKIKQYKEIRDLCKKIYNDTLKKNCQVSSSGGQYLYSTNLGKPIKFDNYYAFNILSKDAEKLMDKHQGKLDTNQAYQEYKEDLRNKKIIKLEEDLPTYSETTGNELYNEYDNKNTRATVSDVEYFYIEDNELVKLGKIQYVYNKYNGENTYGEGGTGDVTVKYYIKFDNGTTVLAYTSSAGEITNKNNFYSKSTPGEITNEEATAETPAAKSIEEEEEHKKQKLKEEKMQMQEEERRQQEEEWRQQEEKRRQQEEKEYNNADTVAKKIAIRLKYNKDYQYYESRIKDLSRYKVDSAAYKGIPEKEKEKEKIKEKITNEEKEKETKQPGGKRISRKKRNMKKSKKGKSKNRR